MTLSEFSPICALLAVQLQCTDADEAMIRAYYQALKDLEPEMVAAAARRLSRQQPGETAWFPRTAGWRMMAERIYEERRRALADALRRRPVPLCLACEDTSWERLASEAVRPCACRRLRHLEILGRRPWPMLEGSNDAA